MFVLGSCKNVLRIQNNETLEAATGTGPRPAFLALATARRRRRLATPAASPPEGPRARPQGQAGAAVAAEMSLPDDQSA